MAAADKVKNLVTRYRQEKQLNIFTPEPGAYFFVAA
jgi:hypothetical protein